MSIHSRRCSGKRKQNLLSPKCAFISRLKRRSNDGGLCAGVCVCNESNLTGEAIPVHKYSSPENDSVYEADSPGGAHHTLFSGTQVLQAGAGDGSTEALGIVTATGTLLNLGRGSFMFSCCCDIYCHFHEMKLFYLFLKRCKWYFQEWAHPKEDC